MGTSTPGSNLERDEEDFRADLSGIIGGYMGGNDDGLVNIAFNELVMLTSIIPIVDNVDLSPDLKSFYDQLVGVAQNYLNINYPTEQIRVWARAVIGRCQAVLVSTPGNPGR